MAGPLQFDLGQHGVVDLISSPEGEYDLGPHGRVQLFGKTKKKPASRNRPKAKNIEPQYARGMAGYIGEDPVNFMKGAASAPFTIAPDLAGMAFKGGNWLRERTDPGANPPFPENFSGDSIREAIGLDPESGQGMFGEMVDPATWGATAFKGAAMMAKPARNAMRVGEDVADAATTSVRGDDVAMTPLKDDGVVVEGTVPPKVKAGEFVSAKGMRAKQNFSQKLEESRMSMNEKDRAQVDSLPDDFDGNVYLTDDGTMGFALSKDGYLSNLFRHPGSPKTGTMGAALTKARGDGAKNLEAFDTYLVRGYIDRGAVETGRFKWDADQATPEIINALGDKKPDFVQMDIGGQIAERKHSQLGPRPQNALARYTETPTGKPVAKPKSIDPIFTPDNIERVKEIAQLGIAEGGDKWYWLGGLLDEFIGELGPELGLERFDKMMDYGAAVSPRSPVVAEIKRSSVLYQRHVRGEGTRLHQPIGSESNPDNLSPAMPEGYGALAHKNHMNITQRLEETGSVGSPALQPKISSYAENKKGNYQPLTADGHNTEIWTGKKKSPSIQEYPHIEQQQIEIAQELGLEPAEWQSAVWVGGKDITGVKDARNMTAAMNQRIAKTAEILDIPEAEAKIKWINGDIILRGLVGTIGLGVGVNAMQEESAGEL